MPQTSLVDLSQARNTASAPRLYPSHILITAAEADGLLDYMEHQYVRQPDHPALSQLLHRLERIRHGSVGW